MNINPMVDIDPTLFCLVTLLVLAFVANLFTGDESLHRRHRPPSHPPGWNTSKRKGRRP